MWTSGVKTEEFGEDISYWYGDPLPGASWIYLFYCITSNEPESLGQWSPGLYKLGSFSIDIDIIYNIIVNIIGDPYLSRSIMIWELYCYWFSF